MSKHCIVLWDDGAGLCWPMGWDMDCDGAICVAGEKEPVVVFETPALAKAAIKISENWARLLQSQDKPYDENFIEYKANLRIVKVTFHDAEAG